jgi:hypothetical protein
MGEEIREGFDKDNWEFKIIVFKKVIAHQILS